MFARYSTSIGGEFPLFPRSEVHEFNHFIVSHFAVFAFCPQNGIRHRWVSVLLPKKLIDRTRYKCNEFGANGICVASGIWHLVSSEEVIFQTKLFSFTLFVLIWWHALIGLCAINCNYAVYLCILTAGAFVQPFPTNIWMPLSLIFIFFFFCHSRCFSVSFGHALGGSASLPAAAYRTKTEIVSTQNYFFCFSLPIRISSILIHRKMYH